jgi:predicted glycoside hydrolase/deacetylase ChbG (UPF0249 family)
MQPKKILFPIFLVSLLTAFYISNPVSGAPSGVRLIVRGDDMGMTQATNEAMERCFKKGILTSASIQVPSPRFEAAVGMCARNPDWCVGIHLTCIAEWLGYRWRPTLPWDRIPSIVDEDGFFYQYPEQLKPEEVDYAELEAEFRAQIELAIKKGLNFHYLDTHYIGPDGYPGLGPILERLSRDYELPVSGSVGEIRGLSIYSIPPAEKEEALAGLLEGLEKPGTYLLVCHPGLYLPENNSCVHADPGHAMKEGIGWHRAEVTRALTSRRIRRIIREREIELTDYRDPAYH